MSIRTFLVVFLLFFATCDAINVLQLRQRQRQHQNIAHRVTVQNGLSQKQYQLSENEQTEQGQVEGQVGAMSAGDSRAPLFEFAFAWPGGGANAARLLINAAAVNAGPINGFAYTLSPNNFVTEATGPVVLGGGTTPSEAARAWVKAWYYYGAGMAGGAPAGVARFIPDGWNAGHIIAASLGGNNDQPLNFFPQHPDSNGQGGIWGRMEQTVRVVAQNMATLPACGANVPIITVTLVHTAVAGAPAPAVNGGTFRVEIPVGAGVTPMNPIGNCATAFRAMPGNPLLVPGVPQLHAYVRAAQDKWFVAGNIQPPMGAKPARFQITIAWTNDGTPPTPISHPILFPL